MVQESRALKVRIAVAGVGLIGKRHVEAIATASAVTLSAIVDPSSLGRDYAEEMGALWYPDLEELIAVDRPDGVILATPNQVHIPNGLATVGAGIPTLIEKPVAASASEAESLVLQAENTNVPLLVGHHRRHNPLITAARTAIDEGRLGRIVSVHGMFWLYKPDDYFEVSWRTEKGAGPVFLNLIHDVDLLRYLVGEITEVFALESNAMRDNAVEDTACIMLRFEGGALGTINVSDTAVAPWSWELTAGENPAYPHTDQACYFIGGTHGSLELPRNRLWHNTGKRSWWEPIETSDIVSQPADPLVRQIENFRDVILGRADPVVSGREGLRALQVVEAVKMSAQQGGPVGLD